MKSEAAFMARECFTMSLDRQYRVYSSGGELVFIKVGGQPFMGQAVAMQFGLLGALVHSWAEKRAKARLAADVASMDRRDLRGLLAKDKANYRVAVAEIASSAIDPQGSILNGPHAGCWLWQASDGTDHIFRFADVHEMANAIDTLQALLGGLQRVNVRWDGKRYVKS